MKKNVLVVISFCLTVLLFCNTATAQAPTGVFAKASTAPLVDGVVDAVWANATAYNIDKPIKVETPTLGASGETTWQALWNNEGVYILLKVTDDVFFPNWAVNPPAGDNWNYDKPEIYFDVNPILADGYGPGTASPNNKGHIQVAPGFPQGKVDGTINIQSDGITYAFLVTGNNYVAEYFVPFSKLIDKTGVEVLKAATIGFDVQLIDRDATAVAKARAVWANTNATNIGESYNNMNACGTVTLQDGDKFVYATNLTLNTGGTITTNNGTLQMAPAFEPADASNQVIKWSVVAGTGMATISSTGVLTGVANGTVTVKAAATDGSGKTATTEVVISGQIIEKNEIWESANLVKNWNFDSGLTSWSNWVDNAAVSAGQTAPAVVDGTVVMKTVKATDNAAWHYQFNQSGLTAVNNVAYTLKFKSWASADATPCVVDFEDPNNGNKRYGKSTDAGAVNGGSEWNYTVGTTPQWFTFHVTYDQIVANTNQKLQWMLSLSPATIYLDSVLLIKDEYLAVKVNEIALNTEGTITTNRGTLQMVATVKPENANNKNVTWSVTPEGMATISPEGLLTASKNGTVTVKAVAADGSLTEATTEVVISGQLSGSQIFGSEFNLIKNWNFDTDMTNWGGWVDKDNVPGMVNPASVEGVAVMKVGKAGDGNAWHYQHNQTGLTAEANVPYVLKFKSWASADATPCAVDFEDKDTNGYKRYGTTTDSESADLKSEWHYNANVKPEWFTFHVTFDSMVTTTVQKIQWMLSLSNETIYLDSVLLVKEEYLDLPVVTAPVAKAGDDQSVDEGATGTLDGSLSSAPEGEELTYRWVAPKELVLSSTTEANPTFTASEVHVDTKYTVSLVVGYGTAKPVYDQVFVTVKQIDKAPYVKAAIENVSVLKGAAIKVIDLKTVFADDDAKDVVTYTVTNSNADVVTSFVATGKLTLTFSTLNTGTSEIKVTATSNGKEVSSTFTVEVKTTVGINSLSDEALVQVFPNPTKGKVELKFSQVSKAGTMITVFNYAGQVILKTVTGDMNASIDLSGNPAGMYFVKVGQKTYKVVLE